MADRLNPELRRLVATRADHLCEYCLLAEEDTYFGCEVDHIISAKHGGATEANNLAYACAFCNRHKGSDIASISSQTNTLVRLYNPRIDRWTDHFELNGLCIKPISEIGEVTARILRFNDNERVLEREALNTIGRYPGALAKARIET